MFKRSLAIIICISLLGLTSAPASGLPCCCKSKQKAGAADKTGLSCCAKKSPPACQVKLAAVHTCCSKNMNQARPCCSKNMLKKDCPGCRCLEQMQIVALTGQVSQDESGSMPTSPADTMLIFPAEPDASGSILTVSAPLGMATLLRTCTLRF